MMWFEWRLAPILARSRGASAAVLPALVPEMSYEGMEVANGQDAGS